MADLFADNLRRTASTLWALTPTVRQAGGGAELVDLDSDAPMDVAVLTRSESALGALVALSVALDRLVCGGVA